MKFAAQKVILGAALMVAAGGQSLFGQQQPPPLQQQPQQPQQQPALPPAGQPLTGQQLDDLVAPIALYPDPLVSQILVAATYPLELVQAGQWLDRNPSLAGTAVVQAAQQENWDPSIQALVVFPDLVKRLNQDIAWTSNLGNAFLEQQADVMDAIQRMRLSAQQGGKLSSNQQQTVTTTYDNGPPVIEIQPANPQVIYVPYYNPSYVWGPSYYYPYANWYYPGYYGGSYFSFGLGIRMGGFFGAGWGGWGGWGWSPGWGNRTIIVNNNFFSRNNFNRGYGYGYGGGYGGNGVGVWAHNAVHRQGVPYNSASLSNQYGGASRVGRSYTGGQGGQTFSARTTGRTSGGSSFGSSGGSVSNGGNRQFAARSTTSNRGSFGGSVQNGGNVSSSRRNGGGNVNRGSGNVNRGNSSNFSAANPTRGNSGGFNSASVSRGNSGGGGVSRGSSGGGGGFSGGGGNRGGGGGGGGSRGGGGGGGSRGGGGGGSRGGGGGRR